MDGWHAWVTCAMGFIAQACTCGLYTSFGTLFVAIINEHRVSETEAAFVGSLSYSLCLLFGCIASPLCNRFGCRKVSMIGSLIYILGLILSSYVRSIEMLYFTFGVVFSIGSSAVYFASLLILAQKFQFNYALAFGIAGSGVGAGGFAFSSLTELSVEKFGLNRTFRFLAACGLILFLGGATYGTTPQASICKHQRKEKSKLFDFSVWKNGAFVIWTIAVCLVFLVYYIPYVHLVKLAVDLEIPMAKASSLLGYFSVASCIGKIIFGKLADHHKINRLYLIQFCVLVVSISHTLCPLSKSLLTLTIYSFICGGFDGGFNALLAVIVSDIVGRENLHKAIGAMYLLSSTFLMFGPPAAGLLYSVSGSYDSSFFIVGGTYAVANCLMFLVPWFLPPDTVNTTKALLEGGSNEEDFSLDYDKKLDKKTSWITYDSGIDLTLQNSGSYTCTLEEKNDSLTEASQSQVAHKKNIKNLFEKYIGVPRKTLLSSNMNNNFALSRLDLYNEELIVVDKVTIV